MSATDKDRSLFRCTGDIQFDYSKPRLGHVFDVHLKQFSETRNFLQYLRPLTPKNPYFFAQVRSIVSSSIVTIGIAGPDISEDAQPGHWNNTVGCHSNTGRCYSSHWCVANTRGSSFDIGDVFGIMVTYFGSEMSTVMFLKNGQPVATRYLFEKDHSKFLPTVALENGPIDLGIVWPEAVGGAPKCSEKNMLNWIVPAQVAYNPDDDIFFVKPNVSLGSTSCIQCPLPLSWETSHFEVVILDITDDGQGPIIAISTCSPILPTPTSELAKDFFKWAPNPQSYQLRPGQRMGWGVHYSPQARQSSSFNDKDRQLVLCYVSLDRVIVYAHVMMQPEGGWYPVVSFQKNVTRIQIDVTSCPRPVTTDALDQLFENELKRGMQKLADDNLLRYLPDNKLRVSPGLKVATGSTCVNVRIADGQPPTGVCGLQYCCPLTRDHCYYEVRFNKLDDESVVTFGIADGNFPLNKYPGRTPHTVGYQSRNGKIFANEKSNANTQGHQLHAGDVAGVEVYHFHPRMSVVIFTKNYVPVGTRYLTLDNMKEYFPTIAIYSIMSEVDIDVVLQNRVLGPKVYDPTNISTWCVPEDARTLRSINMVWVQSNHNDLKALQSPYPLDRGFNHFEVRVIDERDDNHPPPIIGLCTASPYDPPSDSSFKQDVLRFWAIDRASSAVKTGDLVGWGLLYPDGSLSDHDEQLVVCYLTINRHVALTRVMHQPPGGLFPCVFLPSGLDRVALDFGATCITEHPFTPLVVQLLVDDARRLIAEEEAAVHDGSDMHSTDKHVLKYLKPIPDVGGVSGGARATTPNTIRRTESLGGALTEVELSTSQMGDLDTASASTLVKSLYQERGSFIGSELSPDTVRQSAVCTIL